GSVTTINEQRNAATGAARLEYRQGDRRVALDGFVDNRHYVSPPSDELATTTFLMIDREATERATAKYDDKVGKLQLQAQGWVDPLYRRSRTFMDAAFTNEVLLEDLSALRTGGTALVTRPIGKEWRWAASSSVNYESVVVSDLHSNR